MYVEITGFSPWFISDIDENGNEIDIPGYKVSGIEVNLMKYKEDLVVDWPDNLWRVECFVPEAVLSQCSYRLHLYDIVDISINYYHCVQEIAFVKRDALLEKYGGYNY